MPLGGGSWPHRYTRDMAPHAHDWDATYEFNGTTYRECRHPDCQGHQQWICALDRWSDTFETPAPRRREVRRKTEAETPASR